MVIEEIFCEELLRLRLLDFLKYIIYLIIKGRKFYNKAHQVLFSR